MILSVGDGDALVGVVDDHVLLGLLDFVFHLLLGLLDEWLIVSQVSHDVLGEVVLHHCEVGNHWVDLLRGRLLRHHSELVFLFTKGLSVLVERVCLLCDVQLGRFSTARFMREDLSPLKLLLQTVLVEPLQLLNAVRNAVDLSDFLLLRFLRLRFVLGSSRVGQEVEILIFLRLVVAMEFKFPLDDLFEVLVIPVFQGSSIFYMEEQLPSSLRFLSSSILRWHWRIFLSIIRISCPRSEELFFCM